MSRLVQPLIVLMAFCSAMADAKDFEISVSFIPGSGQPIRIVSVDQYCMSKEPEITNLVDGKATLDVDTSGGVFSKCGWVHSSASFEAQNNKKEKKLVFEFYKGLGAEPYLKVLSPTGANCNTLPDFLACDIL